MRKRSHVNFILSLLLCAVMAFSVTAFADGEEAVQQVTDVPSAPAAGAEAPAAVPPAAEQPQETATTASSAQSEGIEVYSEPTGTLEVQQSTEPVQPGPGEVSGEPVNEVGQQEAEEKKEEFSNETGTVAATEEKNSETAVLPGAPEETQEVSGTEASVESAAEVNSEDAAEEKEIPAANPSAEAVTELAEEASEVSEESTEEDDLSYSVTITDTSGASVDVTGGAETLISDLLVSLGYDVPEDALIEIDPESIDTAVISVNETEKGLVLTDNGPFSKAVKNLILYVNGVAIELELVDPTEISGEKTAKEVQEAFGGKDSNPLNVILEGDTVLKGVNESVQLSLGVHDLYLNDHTLSSIVTVEPGVNPVPMFVIGNGVTLNIYGGADNKSAGSGLISSTADFRASGSVRNVCAPVPPRWKRAKRSLPKPGLP